MQLHLFVYVRLLPVVLLALAAPVSAQISGSSASDLTDLDQVVVTATRTAITVDQSLAAVEVIDHDQIQQSQARSLPELLRARAGIDLVNQGGLGKLSTLFLRGTESDHTLFLIDGVRIGSATSGLAALQDLPLELIERIEIVRGPRSSLYGSEAIGGVIQIFTRGAGREGTRARVHVGAGSHGLRSAGAGIDIGGSRRWLGIDYSHQSDHGIDACRGTGAPSYAGCGLDTPDPDRDGYENIALSLRTGLHLTDALQADMHVLRSQGHNAYDSNPDFGLPDNSDTLQQVVGGKLRFIPNDDFTLQLVAGRNRDDSDNFLGSQFTDRFESVRDSISLQGDIGIASGQSLSMGLDRTRDRGAVVSAFANFDADRDNRAAFAQYQAHFGQHDLQAALRHDDNDQFGGHDTGSVAWGVDAGHGLRFTASYGTAFKAPTFNELYYPFYGNPDLRPETSRSTELGLSQHNEGWQWTLNTYQTDIEQLIVYDPTRFVANNLDNARIRGAELTTRTTLAGWRVSGQIGWLDPRNQSDSDFGKLLPRRAQRTTRIDADRGFGDWHLGGSVVAASARYDNVANTLRLGGYATVDLRAAFSFARSWSLQASVHNLMDRDYETAAFYNQPGREFMLNLRYAPGSG